MFVATVLLHGDSEIGAGWANVFAVFIAATFSYIGNTKWSFSESFSRQNGYRFVVTAGIGCLLAYSISSLAEARGLHYLIGIGLIVICVPAVSFLMHYFWTYRPVK